MGVPKTYARFQAIGMTINEFRERINVVLYNSTDRVISTLRILNLFVSASALVVLASYYGFHHESETAELLVTLVKSTFFFYVIQYVTKILY